MADPKNSSVEQTSPQKTLATSSHSASTAQAPGSPGITPDSDDMIVECIPQTSFLPLKGISQANNPSDPLSLHQHKRTELTRDSIKTDYPSGNHSKIHKFYARQNVLIDHFLQGSDEERLARLDFAKNGGKVKWAVNGSFSVNLCLFIIQTFAAISTGSLVLFATAADAFMDLVSSIVMLITSRKAARPKPHKYPVGRRRIETVGIILFCALMTTVAVQLIIESIRGLAGGPGHEGEELKLIPLIFVGAHIFFIDHRNDLAVNIFGLIMSIVGDKFVWYLDPIGAICIALLILFSWVATAFDNVWLLVGKTAPRDFINKCIYVGWTHDWKIQKVDTCRAYHTGEKFCVEMDVVMDEDTPLKVSHDVSQSLQRKLEGLASVERAFVHVDYDTHNPHEEHKPLYTTARPQRRTLREWLGEMLNNDKRKQDSSTPQPS